MNTIVNARSCKYDRQHPIDCFRSSMTDSCQRIIIQPKISRIKKNDASRSDNFDNFGFIFKVFCILCYYAQSSYSQGSTDRQAIIRYLQIFGWGPVIPVKGGLFCIMFGLVTGVGISNLKYCDLSSSRNVFIFGFSLFAGMSIPHWIGNNPGNHH